VPTLTALTLALMLSGAASAWRGSSTSTATDGGTADTADIGDTGSSDGGTADGGTADGAATADGGTADGGTADGATTSDGGTTADGGTASDTADTAVWIDGGPNITDQTGDTGGFGCGGGGSAALVLGGWLVFLGAGRRR